MRLRSFLRQDRGAVAVEFAFVVPIMLALLFCGFETSRLISAYLRLNDSAQMMADLVSRQKSVTAAQIGDFCNGIQLVLKPLPTVGYSATVASVTRSSSGLVVDWQDTSCGTGQPITSATALAAPYLPSTNDSIIVVQATYSYHPVVNSAAAPSIQIVKTGFARSRGGSMVSHS